MSGWLPTQFSVGGGWGLGLGLGLGLEGLVPPPLGALPGGSGAGCDRGWGSGRWAGQRCRAQCSAGAVADRQRVSGSGDGDDAPMVQPMMIGAQQHQVVQLGGAAVLPVPDVVGVQTPGGATPGHRAGRMAILQGTAQPAADQPGRPPRPDGLPGAFQPRLTRGITSQVAPISVRQQRPQMQRRDLVLDIHMHHHRGVLPVRPGSHLGVPAGLDQAQERVTGVR